MDLGHPAILIHVLRQETLFSMEYQWLWLECLAHLDVKGGWLIAMVNRKEFLLGKGLEFIVATCHLVIVLIVVATLAEQRVVTPKLHWTLFTDAICFRRIAFLLNSVFPLSTDLEKLEEIVAVFLPRHRNKIRLLILNAVRSYTNYADF